MPNSPDFGEILKAAYVQAFGSWEQKVELFGKRRLDCHTRGYHRVSDDQHPDPLVCYDCEIFFDKSGMRESGIGYRVVPH